MMSIVHSITALETTQAPKFFSLLLRNQVQSTQTWRTYSSRKLKEQ